MKWTVSIQFTRAKAYHTFFSLVNRGIIKDTRKVNHSHVHLIVEIETNTEPDMERLRKHGKIVDIKIVE